MIVNKKIFINAQWYDPSFPTGIGSYFERLIDKTSDLSENKITIFHSGIKKFQNYKNVEEKESINILSSSYKKILWENINLPIYIFKDNPSIFYSINFSIPFILPKNLRVIATVYDLIWYLFPQYFPRTTVKAAVCRIKRTISRSNIIVTDSENTKKDLMQYFKCPLEKIRVVYPGIDIKKYCNIDSEFTKRVFKKYNISCQYFVWVGDPRPTKNIIRLCEAFREAGLRAMLYIIGPENHRFS